MPTENPNIPGVPIGAESPLVGARVFRRPPNTGFTTAQYTRPRFTVAFLGAYASRSDDSTFLDGYDPNFDNTLLLPNRDLDFGYAKLDLGGTFAISSRFTVFAQAQNLLNNQHIGPIGYPSLPLTFRAGLKIRHRRRLSGQGCSRAILQARTAAAPQLSSLARLHLIEERKKRR